jgi:hypothetical protein
MTLKSLQTENYIVQLIIAISKNKAGWNTQPAKKTYVSGLN